ncbi:FxDxF family PEP-CTERM protein [uncultured Rhodoferax sp.]|uniref:FxDxF family PEP-CTERM protein n=1 Tax=uncultured Rhodoferax sp. TaxID=223188 RepID=UPI0025F67FAD|nr:FxDxF family PEP-CTERM protein [uncultured Rhodoferax sp.]
MQVKSILRTAAGAAVLAGASLGAQAATGTIYAPASGASFTDLEVGSIYISTLSDLTGNFFGASSVVFAFPFPVTLTLGSVTFTSGTVGALSNDLDSSAAGFSFKNVAVGNYIVKASGYVTGSQYPNLSLVAANYTITPVPEPESYALLLAGLGLVGTIARRRMKAKAEV